jgi:hypothetical protein
VLGNVGRPAQGISQQIFSQALALSWAIHGKPPEQDHRDVDGWQSFSLRQLPSIKLAQHPQALNQR